MYANAGTRAQINVMNAHPEQRVEQSTVALQESQDRLSGILGSAMDAIITVDRDQRILLFNSAAEQMFGCPAAEAVGQLVVRFIPQRFQAAHGRHMRNFGETGVTKRTMGAMDTLSAMRADGTEFPIEASISQIVAGGKELFTVILRDITQRVEAQAALRANEEMQRLLLDGVTDYAVYMLDPEGKVASWNAGAARIKGYTAEEILGQPISVFYPPEQQASGVPRMTLQEALVKGRFEGQGQLMRKDGSIFWARVVIFPSMTKPENCGAFPRSCMTSPSKSRRTRSWRHKPRTWPGKPSNWCARSRRLKGKAGCCSRCSTVSPTAWSLPTSKDGSSSGTRLRRKFLAWARPTWAARGGQSITDSSWMTR